MSIFSYVLHIAYQPNARVTFDTDNIVCIAKLCPATAYEKLLEVPLGQIDPHATIVITVGLDNSHPNTPSTESDPSIR